VFPIPSWMQGTHWRRDSIIHFCSLITTRLKSGYPRSHIQPPRCVGMVGIFSRLTSSRAGLRSQASTVRYHVNFVIFFLRTKKVYAFWFLRKRWFFLFLVFGFCFFFQICKKILCYWAWGFIMDVLVHECGYISLSFFNQIYFYLKTFILLKQ